MIPPESSQPNPDCQIGHCTGKMIAFVNKSMT